MSKNINLLASIHTYYLFKMLQFNLAVFISIIIYNSLHCTLSD